MHLTNLRYKEENIMSEIILKNGNLSAVINYHGAELKSLKKGDIEYMWQADPAYWNRTSPVLFPFVGAVSNGVYTYKGTEYKMGQHGFARDMDFELVKSDEKSCEFVLKSSDETISKYPMEFNLYISYILKPDGIEVCWKVENPAENPLEFSIGAHPAFNAILNNSIICLKKNGIPVNPFVNSVFGKGLLTHGKKEIVLDGGLMKLDEHSFDGDAYVLENDQVDEVELLNGNEEKVLSVRFSSPLVGIWSPPTKNAPFICIEPWYGRADKEGFSGELSEREWNNTLPCNASFEASYSIIV